MPWLIAMKGFPGSGKSTLARALGRDLGLPLVDKDDIKDLLDGRLPPDEADALAYAIMLNVVRRQLTQGLTGIADCTLVEATYRDVLALAAETGASLAVLECRLPDETLWRARIEARRGRDLPAHRMTTWASAERYRARYATASFPIAGPHLVLDSSRPLAALVAEARGWLGDLAIA